jgi:hypothetical protein
VSEGWVSRGHARTVYGVILTGDGVVDEEATEMLRQSLREAADQAAEGPTEVRPTS